MPAFTQKIFLGSTLAWMTFLVLLLVSAFAGFERGLSNGFYQGMRLFGTFAILVMTCFAFKSAYQQIGGTVPWYQDFFLVFAVVFWALFPPSWFFVEYTMFEMGNIELAGGGYCFPHAHSSSCVDELKRLEAYGGLASKIWVGMGALLAAATGLLKSK